VDGVSDVGGELRPLATPTGVVFFALLRSTADNLRVSSPESEVRYPSPHREKRFPRLGFAWWLLYYVQERLGSLPFLLLGPTLGAVIGTAVAVSKLSSITIDGKVAAAVPSVRDVLLPALLGGLGGIVVLTLCAVIWGIFSYFRRGDDNWEAHVDAQVSGKGNGVWTYLSKKPKALVVQSQLGRIKVVTRWPSGDFYRLAVPGPATHQHAIVGAAISDSREPGTYLVRWYATEHKAHWHEVARAKYTHS
jgi:hypothetical protein